MSRLIAKMDADRNGELFNLLRDYPPLRGWSIEFSPVLVGTTVMVRVQPVTHKRELGRHIHIELKDVPAIRGRLRETGAFQQFYDQESIKKDIFLSQLRSQLGLNSTSSEASTAYQDSEAVLDGALLPC